MVLFFSHRLSIGLVLNPRILAATALYETYNIPVVKKYNRFIVSRKVVISRIFLKAENIPFFPVFFTHKKD